MPNNQTWLKTYFLKTKIKKKNQYKTVKLKPCLQTKIRVSRTPSLQGNYLLNQSNAKKSSNGRSG